jgi:hypothetical protein
MAKIMQCYCGYVIRGEMSEHRNRVVLAQSGGNQ